MSVLGPIVKGNTVYIVSPAQPRLVLATDLSWRDLASLSYPNVQPALFTVYGTAYGYCYLESTYGYLSYDTSSPPNITYSDSATSIRFVNSTIAPWGAPTLALSSAYYDMQSSQGQTLQTAGGPAASIQIISSEYYFQQSGSCVRYQNPTDSLRAWMCQGSSQNCPYQPFETAWIQATDCQAGVVYTYCQEGYYCGQLGCRGPCSDSTSSCELISDSYGCVPSVKNVIFSPAFVALLALAGIMIALASLSLLLFGNILLKAVRSSKHATAGA